MKTKCLWRLCNENNQNKGYYNQIICTNTRPFGTKSCFSKHKKKCEFFFFGSAYFNGNFEIHNFAFMLRVHVVEMNYKSLFRMRPIFWNLFQYDLKYYY